MLGAFGDDRRWDGYSVAEDAVRRAVLRCYVADGWAPDTMRLAREAALTVDEVRGHLARLRARDRVVLDGDGEAILGAYPFTERATGHRVRLGGIVLNAMCAIDALGVGAMVGQDAVVESRCRQCGAPIRAATAGHGELLAEIEPPAAVVWAGIQYRGGCAATSLCTAIVFFCGDDHLRPWRAAAPSRGRGHRLSAAEALEVGKAIFRPMMRPSAPGGERER